MSPASAETSLKCITGFVRAVEEEEFCEVSPDVALDPAFGDPFVLEPTWHKQSVDNATTRTKVLTRSIRKYSSNRIGDGFAGF